ncbi:transposase family protein [Candidatus Thiosymbion oneisti]|uniref:transposase family protein n=1 Tax=Candidatus Thiosymbion oneisti TaxID=589554 RepID=UPI00106199EF|nr:transposase family protein [Candidatus Thiosymbion oneisti]
MYTDLLSHFSAIKDLRLDKNQRDDLEEILRLCLCAVVSGAEGWEGIWTLSRTQLDGLRQFLPYANGISSADCLGWVMARRSQNAFQDGFVAWTRSVAELSTGEVVTIDGCQVP